MKTRRKFSPEQKTKIVLSIIDGSKTVLEVSREHELSPSLIHKWKDHFLAEASVVFAGKKEDQGDRQKIRKYEHVIAKLTTQNDFLDKVLTTLK
jgi:transposase-like protein